MGGASAPEMMGYAIPSSCHHTVKYIYSLTVRPLTNQSACSSRMPVFFGRVVLFELKDFIDILFVKNKFKNFGFLLSC